MDADVLASLRTGLTSDRLTRRQKVGAAFLLGWAQLVPWVTIQLLPILAFTIWRDGGIRIWIAWFPCSCC